MPKTLLLADDSVTIQKVVGICFASEDTLLIAVDNGDDAIATAREEHPDAILADIVMPGKNGYEVCEAIKADPALAHIPVLLLTGMFEAFDAERAERVGAAGHIAKPFESQTLVDVVTNLFASTPSPATAAPPVSLAETVAEVEMIEVVGENRFDDDLLIDSELGPAASLYPRSGSDLDVSSSDLEPVVVGELETTGLSSLEQSEYSNGDVLEPIFEPTARAEAVSEQIEPQLRKQLRDTLEKIACEAFGNLTEAIVRQSVEKVEQIAWEVVPQLIEALVREEIQKMQDEPPSDA